MSGKVWLIEERRMDDWESYPEWYPTYEEHGVFSSKKHAEKVAAELEANHFAYSQTQYDNDRFNFKARHRSWRISRVLWDEGLGSGEPGPEPQPPAEYEEWRKARLEDPDRKPFYRVVGASLRRESRES